jgi:hypothetical protein
MSIYNRRNAVLGWTVWTLTKNVAKQKAKVAAPRTVHGTNRRNASAAALSAAAACVGAVWVWRHRGQETELLAS